MLLIAALVVGGIILMRPRVANLNPGDEAGPPGSGITIYDPGQPEPGYISRNSGGFGSFAGTVNAINIPAGLPMGQGMAANVPSVPRGSPGNIPSSPPNTTFVNRSTVPFPVTQHSAAIAGALMGKYNR